MPTRPWSDKLSSTAARFGTNTQLKLAQRPTDARLSLMYKIVHNPVLIEAIKYVKPQRNLINLQQILVNKKYYEMLFFPRTVKD